MTNNQLTHEQVRNLTGRKNPSIADTIATTRNLLHVSSIEIKVAGPSSKTILPESTKREDIGRIVGNIQLESTKLALASLSRNLQEDAKRIGGASNDNDRAIMSCISALGTLSILLLNEFTRSFQLEDGDDELDLKFAVDFIVKERRARLLNLCRVVENLLDEIEGKQRDPSEESLTRDMTELSVSSTVLEPESNDDEDDAEQHKEYQRVKDGYVCAGIVIEQCQQLRKFERMLSNFETCGEVISLLIAEDTRKAKDMIKESWEELKEYVENPTAPSEMDIWGLEDDDDKSEQDNDDDQKDSEENRSKLVELSKLWVNRINLISILYISIIKRRFSKEFYRYLESKSPQNTPDVKFTTFLNKTTPIVKTLADHIDDFVGGFWEGVDIVEQEKTADQIKNEAESLVNSVIEVAEDDYRKWFVMWKQKFLEGL
ncbi:hypothetical protein V1511DRAFT_494873 [Dipodascopsis uninucleata]